MKQKFIYLFIVLFAFSWHSGAQVSIGNGTDSGQGLPVEPFYGYSYSQVIYLQSEINAAGDITTLTWDFAGTSLDNSNEWTIYIGHTTKTEFSSTTDWVDVSTLTQVFSGTVSVDANNKVVVDITDFTYNNTDNLVIAVDENASSYDGSSDDFNCTAVSGNRGLLYRNDSTNPDPTNPPTASYRRQSIANIVLGGISQACPEPSGLTTNNITDTTADFDWTENGSASNWTVEYKAGSDFTPGTGAQDEMANVQTHPYGFAGLAPNTTYYWYVRADCGGANGSSSWAGPYTFTTDCSVYSPDYTQDFATFVPDCWDEADSGDATSGPGDIGASPWTSSTSLGTGSARINLYGTYRSDWLLSPEFDLSAGGYEVVVEVAVTDWNNGDPDAMGSDDEVQLLYTEDGTNWTNITTWTAADNLSNTPTQFSFNLTSTGSNVQFGFLATDGPTDDSEDYDFHVADFKVRTPPACPNPSDLSAGNITDSQAELSWTENGSASVYNIELGATGFNPTGNPTNSGVANPFTVNGLNASTTYDYYVQADCGSGSTSTWAGPYSFTTLVGSHPFPLLEDFENGFTYFDNGDSNDTDFADETTIVHGGTHSVHDAYISSSNDILVETGRLDLSGTSAAQLIFWHIAKTEGTFDKCYVEISTDGGSTYNVLPDTAYQGAATDYDSRGYFHEDSYSIWGTGSETPDNTWWRKETFSLASYNVANVRIRFRLTSDSSANRDGWYIDDIHIFEPSCPAPMDLSSSNITQTSADLSWTTGGASNWEIVVQAAGTGTPAGSGIATSVNSYAATGLTSNTDYEFYVRDFCDPDYSEWTGPYLFTTLCSSITATYSENFDGVSRPDLPSCWHKLVDATSSYAAVETTTTNNTSPNGARLYNSSDDSATLLLISPQFSDLTSQANRIRFMAKGGSNGYDLIVGTMSDPLDQSTFTAFTTITLTDAFVEYTVDFDSSYSGSDQFIAFKHGLGGTYRSLYIDDFVYEPMPSCPDPSDLSVANITASQAELSWTENGSASVYNIELGATGFAPTGNATNSGVANPFTVTGLNDSTTYDYYVQADCGGGDSSNWVGPYTFSTPDSCPPPSAGITSNIFSDAADLGWTSEGAETTWNIEYGAAGFAQGNGTTVSVTANPYTLNGLTSNTAYEWYVQADCGNGDVSNSWSGPYAFMTPPACGETFYDDGGANGSYSVSLNQTITIYPENQGDVVSVTFNSFDMEQSWDGMMVYNGTDTNSPLIDSGSTYNHSACPNGAWTGAAGGTYSANRLNFTSTDASGALTFVFTSDGSVQHAGWEAVVNCHSRNNDEAADATTVSINDYGSGCQNSNTVDNSYAYSSTSVNGNPGCGYAGKDVWFKFDAPATDSGSVIMNVTNNDWERMMYNIYDTPTSRTPIYSNCQEVDGVESVIINGLTPGNTYYLRVWSYMNIHNGTVNFCLENMPDNDAAAGATQVNLIPFTAICQSPNVADNTFASSSTPVNAYPGCNYRGKDVWFKFDAPNNGRGSVILEVISNDWDRMRYSIYDSPTSTTPINSTCKEVDGIDSVVLNGLTPGQTYYLRLWSYFNLHNGSVEFCLKEMPAYDEAATAPEVTLIQDGAACESPVVLQNNLVSSSTPINGYPGCNYRGRDVWVKFDAPASGDVTMNVLTNDWDRMRYTIYDSPTSTTPMYSICNEVVGTGSAVFDGLTAGNTYYLRLWSYLNIHSGTVSFCLSGGAGGPTLRPAANVDSEQITDAKVREVDSNLFSVASVNETNISSIMVYDLSGRLMYRNDNVNSTVYQVQFKGVSGNIYIFSIGMNNDTKKVVRKVLKQ